MRPAAWLLLLTLFALAALGFALSSGSVDIGWDALLQIAAGNGEGMAQQLVMELRLPRALSAFATGGLLALAGALLQVLLRNPLADPYVLGVSGGAAVAALLAMLAGITGWGFSASALAGALFTVALVFGLAHGRGSWSDTRLLLVGVIVASGWGAVIAFILAVAPEQELRGMLFWLMGDLSSAGEPLPALLVLVAGVMLIAPVARSLNVMARGELQAAALGVEVGRLRLVIYFGASLFTATAVTLAGSVGFVGLVVPHLLRLLLGNDHRLLLPAAVLLGGGLLVLADTLARTIIAPQQLPVGVLTALLGVPVFLYLLQRRQ
ncbi:MAG TPA: iron ABC transporter permease [Gammaproteobacteria bacterium]|nr:iron ABC transporter permease [Gammaproteobacteria bacterium]